MANTHIKSYAQFINEAETTSPVMTISAYPNKKIDPKNPVSEFDVDASDPKFYFEISGLPNVESSKEPIQSLTLFGEGMTQLPSQYFTQKKEGNLIKGSIERKHLGNGVTKTLIHHIKTSGKNLGENYALCAVNYYDEAAKKNKDATPKPKFVDLSKVPQKMATKQVSQISTSSAPQQLAPLAQNTAQETKPKKKFLGKLLGK